MNAQVQPFDRTALGWVKPELDALLERARSGLEAFAEGSGDASVLAETVLVLGQVRGSLELLALEAPALLADELSLTAQALQRGQAQDKDTASAALLRGTLQLPDYIEHLQGGHRDVPIVLKPLIDDVRSARGEAPLDVQRLAAMGAGPAPTEDELARARATLGGRNRALLGTVSSAVNEDLAQVRDALDLQMRSGRPDPETLQPQVAVLDRVAGTLAMIGLDSARARLAQQRDVLHAIASGARAPDEDALLQITTELLHVEGTLENSPTAAGAGTRDDTAGPSALQAESALVREAVANMGQVRDGILAATAEGWRPAEASEAPRLLREVSGALRMLQRTEQAIVAEALEQRLRSELTAAAMPDPQRLDHLAEAITSLDLYLESLADGGREELLEVARSAIEVLGSEPPPASPDAGNPVTVAPSRAEAAAPAANPPAPSPQLSGFDKVGEEIDDEIREVFIEEFEAEIGNLGDLLPAWRVNPDDMEALRPLRRVFHTLKGSGRLVGARALGELSWSIESLLNRVLDGSRPASPAVFATVERAQEVFPQMLAALRGERAVAADLDDLMQAADRVALGSEETVVLTMQAAPAESAASEEPGIPARVDAMLLEILEAEVGGHLQTIEHWLQARAPKPDEALFRALHTSNGAFAVTEVPAVGELLDPAEGYVKRLLASGRDASTEGTGAIGAVVDAVRETLTALRAPDPKVRPLPELGARLQSLRDALPEPATPDRPADLPDLDALGLAIVSMPQAPLALEDEAAETERLEAQRIEAERLEAERVEADRVEAEHLEAERLEAERLEAERLEAERLEAERLEAERLEAERLEAERLEAERLEAERLEAERLEAERLDAERLEAERLEAERLEAERLEAERLEAERLEAERLEAERLEAERVEAERVEAERVEAERVEAERLEAERVEAERLEAERLEAERLEAGRVEAERVEAERLEAERVEVERLEAERLEAERVEVERLKAERLEAERLEAERLEAERVEAEHLEAERVEAERVEAERLEAERLEAERLEAERLEAERLEAERLEAERLEAERLEAERLETERLEAERLEAERLEAERLEAERLETERLEAERLEAERLETERLEAERLEAERLEAERLEAERLETERLEAERLEAERLEAERLETERLETERLEAERLEAERLEAERLEAERLEAERLEAERLEAKRLEAERTEAARLAAEKAQVEQRARAEQAEAERQAALLATAAAAAAAEDPDEALDLADLDPELVDLFVEEARDLLDHSDGLLAKLRQSPAAADPVVGLQRDLHTLKGGARMAGIMAVGELGHTMEALLEQVAARRTELTSQDIPLLERGFDRLHGMVVRVGARRAIGLPAQLIAEFDARARGEVPGVAARAELKPLSSPIEVDSGFDDDDIAVRAPQEQVRIRAELLDRLVNYAGEVAIYRARLEQQLGAFRSAMFEMEQTNARLRDQLRRLDAETEAQIIARYQRAPDASDGTFDPLELDRFSTLQQLSRGLSESAADLASLQGTLEDLTRQYDTLLLQQSRVSSDLQEGLMRTRMVPFEGLVPRLRRVVRQAASETGKQVQLKLDGAQGELDRSVLERMTAPLEHMLRNAVAHGLESPQARRNAGKGEEGTVTIAVRREGSEVVLQVVDDGIGLDRAAIRRRGEERGLVRPDAELSDAELDTLILEPGFSTANEVSRLAGRGVGMDVVASEVRQLGGTLDITSTTGRGTAFLMRLPQTLAVTQAVFVRIGETRFAVPVGSVRGVARIDRELANEPGASFRYGGEDYPLHDLGNLLGQAPVRAEGQAQMPLVLIRAGELRAAVCIDQVIGNREVVVKPVGPQVASIPGIFGATIMGDGSVVVLLDIAPLVRRAVAAPRVVQPAPMPEQRRVPLVMVVDDSVTMRKVTARVLERHNYEVVTAKDGIDAIERLEERVPDLMLLDIEMPRMDGYELATHMRGDRRLREVPIIMITSRTGDKHRQRAFDLGVRRYLGKPYQEPDLMRNVVEILKDGSGDNVTGHSVPGHDVVGHNVTGHHQES